MKTIYELKDLITKRAIREREKNDLILYYNLEIGPLELKKAKAQINLFETQLKYLDLSYQDKAKAEENHKRILEEYKKMNSLYQVSLKINSQPDLTDEEIENIDSRFDNLLTVNLAYYIKRAPRRLESIISDYVDGNLANLKKYKDTENTITIEQDLIDSIYLIELNKVQKLEMEFPLNTKNRLLNTEELNEWKKEIEEEIEKINLESKQLIEEFELKIKNDGLVS